MRRIKTSIEDMLQYKIESILERLNQSSSLSISEKIKIEEKLHKISVCASKLSAEEKICSLADVVLDMFVYLELPK